MRLLLFALCLSFTPLWAEPSLVVLVRHAEMEPDGTKDPHLSAVGRQRAELLAQMMESTRITHVFTSEYQRTKETGAVVASWIGVPAKALPAREPDALLATVRALPSTAKVLIVGHSNTVPELAEALGGTEIELIPEDDFSRLIGIRYQAGSPVRTVNMRYGDEPILPQSH